MPAIAEAINLRFQADNRPPKKQLLDYLRHKQLLLVLDNFEHLQAGAELMLELLQACPGLHMLVTAREQLQLNSEMLFVLESMALPSTAALPDVLSYSAVQLFVETARRVRPKFTLTSTNAQAIVHICQLVGGMPLGIILAAAWVEVLSPNDIVTELSQGFEFSAAELRDLPERQRSMRAVLTQSWQRLTEAERAVFMRLAVFRGGFTRLAAEQVAGASVRMLSSFVNKSLVQCEPNRRYTIHEFLRQYAEAELEAADQLDEAGEADAIRRAHALHYLAMAEQAEPEFHRAEQRSWLDRLNAEHDNLRAALAWSQAAPGGADVGLRLAGTLWLFWFLSGHISEGREWLAVVLAREMGTLAARAKVLTGAGYLAFFQEDYVAAHASFEESLALFRKLGHKDGIAAVLRGLGSMATEQGDYGQAETQLEESLALFRELGDTNGTAGALHRLGEVARDQDQHVRALALLAECLILRRDLGDKLGFAYALNSLGDVAHIQGDYVQATARYQESAILFRELENTVGLAWSLHSLGHVTLDQRDNTPALKLFAESLALFHEERHRAGIACCLEKVAAVISAQAQPERAAQLFGAASSLQTTGDAWDPRGRADADHTVAMIRAQLDETTFAAAWAEGQTMTLDEAVAYALVSPELTIDG